MEQPGRPVGEIKYTSSNVLSIHIGRPLEQPYGTTSRIVLTTSFLQRTARPTGPRFKVSTEAQFGYDLEVSTDRGPVLKLRCLIGGKVG